MLTESTTKHIDRLGEGEQIRGAIWRLAFHEEFWDGTWMVTTDLDEMLQASEKSGGEHTTIWGETVADIGDEIQRQHSSPPMTTRVTFFDGRPSIHRGTYMKGYANCAWRVERHPVFTGASLDQLKTVIDGCDEPILLTDAMRDQLGGSDELRRLGFLLTPRRSRNASVVKYNKHAAALRVWREQCDEIKKLLPDRPDYVLLGQLMGHVTQLPTDHKWEQYININMSASHNERVRNSRGRRHNQNDFQTVADAKSLQVVQEAIKLYNHIMGRNAHRKSTRVHQYNNDDVRTWPDDINEMLTYIHGFEASEHPDSQEWAQYLRKEARVLKLKLPPKPKLPPRPKTTKPRKKK